MKENFLLLPLVELGLTKDSKQRGNVANNQTEQLLNFSPAFGATLKRTIKAKTS